MKHWRDIVGEEEQPIDVLSLEESAAKRNPEYAEKLEMLSTVCGYVEAPSVGYFQESPGVGCQYIYDNPEDKGTLAGKRSEWVSISADSGLSLKGQKMEFNTTNQEDTNGSVKVPDIEE